MPFTRALPSFLIAGASLVLRAEEPSLSSFFKRMSEMVSDKVGGKPQAPPPSTAKAAEKPRQAPLPKNVEAMVEYWYSTPNLAHIDGIDAALASMLSKGKEQAPEVTDFESWEDAIKHRAYHDTGSLLLVRSYTYLYYGRQREAQSSVDLLVKTFPFSMLLKADRTVVWTRKALRYHQHCQELFSAMAVRKVSSFCFGPETDEFDCAAQRQACAETFVLRLNEKLFDAVERLTSIASSQDMRTSGGQPVMEYIYYQMAPLERERHSDAAWRETEEKLRSWKREMPNSQCADLAYARFSLNWAGHLASRYSDAYPAMKKLFDKAQVALAQAPKDNPGWFTTALILKAALGEPGEEMIKVFYEGLTAFPEYTPLYQMMADGLAAAGSGGGETLGQFFKVAARGDRPEIAAQMLMGLHSSGHMEVLVSRVEARDMTKALQAGLAVWRGSIETRNRLAAVAVALGQRDVARLAMEGMEGRYIREVWRGNEDVARELSMTPPRQKAGGEARVSAIGAFEAKAACLVIGATLWNSEVSDERFVP